MAEHTSRAIRRITQQRAGLLKRPSLLTSLVLITAASTVIMSAALFLLIDEFVSNRFENVRAERVTQAGRQVERAVAREVEMLRNLAELMGNDAELNNATYYHLYLDGEVAHPTNALQKQVRVFHLDAAKLWDATGRLVASAPRSTPMVPPPYGEDRTAVGLIWVDGRPWLSATHPLARSGSTIAYLWVGRPLANVLDAIFPQGGEVSVRLAQAGLPSNAHRIRLAHGEQPIWLDLTVDDNVGRALTEVKRLLVWLLPVSGLTLALLLGWVLHRQLSPLAVLTRAVTAVGRGEFGQRLESHGTNEVAQLIDAFNTMTHDLIKLRELERRAQQHERLSAIGRMAAKVAHDINNPLTVIRGVAELMEKQAGGNDAQAREDSRLIQHHIERCQRTVGQLLAYGRPLQLKRESLDINHTVGEICARWQGGHPNVAVVCSPAGEALRVSIDPYQFERVLDNLLTNACHAAPDQPIEVRLSRQDDLARISVIDLGPGFSAEARAHLFEPFYSSKRGGSGLGLASALVIVEAHGGSMMLGETGRSEVVVRLPLARE